MIHPFVYYSAIGTAYSLAVDFIFDNLDKQNAIKETIKSAITGVALAAIRQQFGLKAVYGAAIGLALSRSSNDARGVNANMSRVVSIALGAFMGAWVGSWNWK